MAGYQYLTADIEERGYKFSNMSFKISHRNKETLMFLAHTCKETKPKNMINLLGSYQIYLARKSQSWTPGGLMRP